MRILLSILVALGLTVGVMGCAKKEEPVKPPTETTAPEEKPAETTPAPETKPEEKPAPADETVPAPADTEKKDAE